MSVQVMSKRKFQIDEIEKLISLLSELSSRSKEQPGHISRETLKSLIIRENTWSEANGRRLSTGINGCTVKKEGIFRAK